MTNPKKPVKVIKLIDVREVVNKIISEEISMSRGQEILNEKIHDHKLSQLSSVEEIRLFLISNLDFFREWAERSYKNTNDMKHENTPDIIERFAKSIHSLMREVKEDNEKSGK